MSSDPWTEFLNWLNTVLVPSWGELIALIPFVVVGTIVGPILTIIVLMWAWYLFKRRRGHVSRGEAAPTTAAIAEDGSTVYPVNTPYCEEHALVYPPRARHCNVDGADLSVACPVDGTVRDAEIDTCAACGTKFVLGASSGPMVVTSSDGPPEGGAAVA
ncbi:MAG: hypothetical protein ACR2N6_04705 [Miltoncostaeaceae bacterium]